MILSFVGQSLAILVLILGLYQTGASQFLGFKQILSKTEGEETELIVKGLYRWVRHPLYSGGLLFIWLTPIMTTSILTLNIGLTVYIYIGSILEERRLKREFGAAYVQYQLDVPRIFPRIQLLSR